VVIGGLIISSLLTLFVIPLLYILIEKGFKKGYHSIRSSAIVLIILSLPMMGNSQQSISLKDAVDSALKKNAALLAARTEVSIQRSLQRSYFDPGATQIGFEYGKLNSFFTDNKLYINQSIQLPSVYNKQKNLYSTNVSISEADVRIREVELAAQVKTIFYEQLLLQEKRKWLQTSDSFYRAAASKAGLRYKAGDIDLSEKAAAENQQLQVQAHLQLLETDLQKLQNELKMLLQTTSFLIPIADSLRYPLQRTPDTSYVQTSPWMLLQQQRIRQGEAEYEVQKSGLLPGFSVGYNNMSIAGWQKTSVTTERFFNRGDRFSYVGLGMGLPILRSAQKARIKAASLSIDQRKQESLALQNSLNAATKNAMATYLQTQSILKGYENIMLPNATSILRSAEKRLSAGEINFLEWLLLAGQALDIRLKYLDLLQEHNRAAVLIEKWTSNQ
jgi:cobalt-zinc-cadmium resistance protein CzcA